MLLSSDELCARLKAKLGPYLHFDLPLVEQAELRRHVSGCKHCAAFLKSVIPVQCYEVFVEVSAYVDDDLEPETRARLSEHFRRCAHCAAIVDGTRNVVQLLSRGEVLTLPQGLSKRLYAKLVRKPSD